MTDNERKTDPNTENEEAWDAWPYEMPTTTDNYTPDNDFKRLNDKDFIRKMLVDVRNNFLDKYLSHFKHISNGAIILKGGEDSSFELYDTDVLHCNFRQEPFFRYLFGLNEPNAYGIIDLSKKEFILLVELMPKESERWLGDRKTFKYYKSEYLVQQVDTVKRINTVLEERNIKYLYLLKGKNTDSGLTTKTTADFKGIKNYWTNYDLLYPILSECRVIKTRTELQLIESACRVTSKAHVYVMRHIKINMKERQLEALFKGYSYFYGGARHQAYECICGSGVNGSILHYGHSGYPNDRTLKDGDTVVLDMGSEYNGYATDITCSYPVNGVFTKEQKLIHTIVYNAQQAVLNSMKPGIDWKDMHRLSERIVVEGLFNIGILQCKDKNPVDTLMKNNLGAVFMPHGLGHFIGMCVHDVGGFNIFDKNDNKFSLIPRSKELGLCWLRTTRILQEGMVITVEPGIYFNKSWIEQMCEKYKNINEYINKDVLKNYINNGGVRLEDDVVVTKNGCKNFTICPRSVQQIERVMKLSKQSQTKKVN